MVALYLFAKETHWSRENVPGEVFGSEHFRQGLEYLLEFFYCSEGLEAGVSHLSQYEVAAFVSVSLSEVSYFFIDENVSSGELVE